VSVSVAVFLLPYKVQRQQQEKYLKYRLLPVLFYIVFNLWRGFFDCGTTADILMNPTSALIKCN